MPVSNQSSCGNFLRQSAAGGAFIFNSIAEGVLIVDAKTGNPLDVNRAMLEMYGLSSSKARSWSFFRQRGGKPPYTKREAQQYFDRACKGERVVFTWYSRKAASAPLWTYNTAQCVSIDGRNCVTLISADLSEQIEANHKIRNGVRRIQNIIQSSPMGTQQYRLEQDGTLRLIAANDAATRILKSDCQQKIGLPIEEAFPALLETDIPSQCRRIAREGGVWQKEFFVYADDQVHGVYDFHAFQTEPMNMAVFFTDVTERHETHRLVKSIYEGTAKATGEDFFHCLVQQLARSLEVRYAMIAEIIDDDTAKMHAIWKGDGFGQNIEYRLSCTPCHMALNDEICIIPEGLRDRYPGSVELREMKAESYLGIMFRDVAGKPLGLLCVMDIKPMRETNIASDLLRIFTIRAGSELERRRAEQKHLELERQFQHSQKMDAVGQLAGGIAHDFNNLLQAIQGYSELAINEICTQQPIREFLDEIINASMRASALVRKLLAMGRREHLNWDCLNINDEVNELKDILKRLIGAKIRIEFDPGDKLPLVYADSGHVEQILLNLCVNARDAMPKEGVIRISTSQVRFTEEACETLQWARTGDYIQIRVCDNGKGIEPRIMERIFEPFFTTKPFGHGAGLGLATVYSIVQQHDGLINVESEPGSGACFEIYLPVATKAQIKRAHDLRQRPAKGKNIQKTVLLAEDERLVRNLLQRTLERESYHVLAAGNGEEARQIYHDQSSSINFALLDIVMPRMNGNELASELRKNNPALPILFMSGYGLDALDGEFENDPQTSWMQKPVRTADVCQKVHEMLNDADSRDAKSSNRKDIDSSPQSP
ncbi:response regulator [Candidatus Sumerlaeota bacterium]|nr:response regulator [Candidatus Sumerlaeota bacterium]